MKFPAFSPCQSCHHFLGSHASHLTTLASGEYPGRFCHHHYLPRLAGLGQSLAGFLLNQGILWKIPTLARCHVTQSALIKNLCWYLNSKIDLNRDYSTTLIVKARGGGVVEGREIGGKRDWWWQRGGGVMEGREWWRGEGEVVGRDGGEMEARVSLVLSFLCYNNNNNKHWIPSESVWIFSIPSILQEILMDFDENCSWRLTTSTGFHQNLLECLWNWKQNGRGSSQPDSIRILCKSNIPPRIHQNTLELMRECEDLQNHSFKK